MDEIKLNYLLKHAWDSIKWDLGNTLDFRNEPTKTDTKPWNNSETSSIRRYGSEDFLKSIFYANLKNVFEKESCTVSVEYRYELKNKHKIPDIIVWKGSIFDKEPILVIELKVTGSLWWSADTKKANQLKDELIKYNNHPLLANTNALFFIGCYYESKPDEILDRINQFGNVRNSLTGVDISEGFNDRIIEGYGFIGCEEDWIIINT